MIVRPIAAAATLAVRLAVLRPGYPPEAAIFDGDEDSGTRHLGLFLPASPETPAGVASLFRVPCPDAKVGAEIPGEAHWQLRGMAVREEIQGKGGGSLLLAACVDLARSEHPDGTLIWCNARVGALSFYLRHGFAAFSAEFLIPGVGPHHRLFREI